MTKSDPPESSPQSQSEFDADTRGAFEAAAESEPIAPILKQAIEHIKKSNRYQKETTKGVLQQSKLLADQNKTMRFLLVTLLLGVLVGVWLGVRIEHVVHEGESVTANMDKLGTKLTELERDMRDNVAKKEDVKAAVNEAKKNADGRPKAELVSDGEGKISVSIPVKVETTADPNTMTSAAPVPTTVEIPVQLPKHVDLKVGKKRTKK